MDMKHHHFHSSVTPAIFVHVTSSDRQKNPERTKKFGAKGHARVKKANSKMQIPQ